MSETRLSFVIPARNEEALIGETMEAILGSVARSSGVSRHDLWLPDTSFEVIVADDESEDATPAIVSTFADGAGVRLVRCAGGTCAAARNAGAAASVGRVLCFVDADTIVPENAVDRILELHEDEDRCLVLYRLVSREPGPAGARLAAGVSFALFAALGFGLYFVFIDVASEASAPWAVFVSRGVASAIAVTAALSRGVMRAPVRLVPVLVAIEFLAATFRDETPEAPVRVEANLVTRGSTER